MSDWEYQQIDLSQHGPRSHELDMLNGAGTAGWELVSITGNNVAYLKRRIDRDPPPQGEPPPPPVRPARRKSTSTPE
jgi:hypothetical protein